MAKANTPKAIMEPEKRGSRAYMDYYLVNIHCQIYKPAYGWYRPFPRPSDRWICSLRRLLGRALQGFWLALVKTMVVLGLREMVAM